MQHHNVGDVVTLSSTGVMQDHNVLELDCEIIEKRNYKEAGGRFNYTAYICKPIKSETVYMLLVRQVGSDSDIMLYYNDHGMDVREVAEFILNPDGQDLVPQYSMTVTDTAGNPHEILWEKKSAGTFFGAEFRDSDGVKGIRTVCEYGTKSECGGNPHTFIDWAGDNATGWIEFWVGCQITSFEVKITTPAKPL